MFNAVLLSCIELRDLAIESSAVNGFELRAIDAPLLRRYLKPGENRRQAIFDVPALVRTNDAAGPVGQFQVVFEVERYTGLRFGRAVVLEVQRK